MNNFKRIRNLLAFFCIACVATLVFATFSFNQDKDEIAEKNSSLSAFTYSQQRYMGKDGESTKKKIEGLFHKEDEAQEESSVAESTNPSYEEPVPYTPSTTDTADIPSISAGKNPCPIYKQGDSRWSSEPFGSSGTIGRNGCGACSMAMGISYLTKKQVLPTDIIQFCKSNGISPTIGNNFSWGAVQPIANGYGLRCTQQRTLTKGYIQEVLDAGGVLVWRTGSGWFTKGRHFMCIPAYASDDHESVYIANSSGVTYVNGTQASTDDSKAWNIDEFLSNGVNNPSGWGLYLN